MPVVTKEPSKLLMNLGPPTLPLSYAQTPFEVVKELSHLEANFRCAILYGFKGIRTWFLQNL